MSKPYLEITYRQGKPFAAYLYLERRPGDKAHQTKSHGSYVIDYAFDGRAIGIEFLQINQIDLAGLNQILASAHHPALSQADLVPLQAA